MSEPNHWSQALLNDSGDDLIYEVEGDAQRGNPLDIVTVAMCCDARTVLGLEFPAEGMAKEMRKRWNVFASVYGPDDDEPTTTEWLKSIGFEVGLHWAAVETPGRERMEWRAAGMWIGEHPIALTDTRGKVRRLCVAMGIVTLPAEQGKGGPSGGST